MGRAVGQTLKEFKKSANEFVNSDDDGKATKVEATKIGEDKK